jgi:hypothetical protein
MVMDCSVMYRVSALATGSSLNSHSQQRWGWRDIPGVGTEFWLYITHALHQYLNTCIATTKDAVGHEP